MVEYSLVFVFFVVISISAVKLITNATKAEVANQQDCISKRPPPASCQIRPASTTTAPPPPTTPTTAPGPTLTTTTTVVTTTTAPTTTTTSGPTTTTTTLAPPNPALNTTKQTSPKGVDATVTVKSGTTNIPNATVRVRFDVDAPGGSTSFEVNCTTDATGSCTIDFNSPYTDATKITATVVQVTSVPPAGSLPPAQSVTFP